LFDANSAPTVCSKCKNFGERRAFQAIIADPKRHKKYLKEKQAEQKAQLAHTGKLLHKKRLKQSERDTLEKQDLGKQPDFTDESGVFDPKMAAQAELAKRELARRHLLPFVQRFNDSYIPGWVHKDICLRLEKFSDDVAAKKSPRLMLFMPPRHGKSELASKTFPAWHLGRYPNHEFIACSYSGSLAMGFSRKVRGFLRDQQYQSLFETRLDPESQGAEQWLTTEGGGYVAAGVGGPITGKGAHILVIDDPVKNREQAESETARQTAKDWYTSTAYTRLAPGGGILVILTRWHDDDLAGWLLEQEKDGGDSWEVIKYPAIAEEDEKYRKKHEPLHPARYDSDALMRIQKAVGPRDWSALYQQNPVADEGEYFKLGMFQYYKDKSLENKKLKVYCAWDLAIGKADRNDFSVGVVVGVDQEDKMYVMHVERGKWDGFELVEKILDVYEEYRPSIVGIERGHIEMALGPFLKKRIKERNLYEMYLMELKTGRRDKEARARAIQGRMQQGMVFFPKFQLWNAGLMAEMLRFPNGVHDDQVDGLAWIGLMMSEMSTVVDQKIIEESWRDKLPGLMAPNRSKSAMSA
jgi:predicted phage terminase large subunit-like protein|tara:strand:- start:722 stop:2464 length:1743 start_codon:yes stop_codon:yes gene_type:complete